MLTRWGVCYCIRPMSQNGNKILIKDAVLKLLHKTEVPLTTICKKAGVNYSAVHQFRAGRNSDMKSENVQKLYEYLTNTTFRLNESE